MMHKYGMYSKGYVFKEGDLVQWKPGLRHRKRPAEGEVGVVVRVLDVPVYPHGKREDDAGSALFREKLDIAVGVLDEEDDFVVFHFDSNRLMPAFSNDSSPQKNQMEQLFQALTAPLDPTLKPGDFVQWKHGLKNKRRPYEGEKCMIVEILPEPIYDLQKSAGTPNYREPLTAKLAFVDDGNFLVYHYDLRRFERASP
ncbi:hypothetical protein Pelo_928 [Pelomyxa schiedti]|nr:hypothetical protein Pelo_928 [Pelomyxa schiedti]